MYEYIHPGSRRQLTSRSSAVPEAIVDSCTGGKMAYTTNRAVPQGPQQEAVLKGFQQSRLCCLWTAPPMTGLDQENSLTPVSITAQEQLTNSFPNTS